jgi:hypothetical protein
MLSNKYRNRLQELAGIENEYNDILQESRFRNFLSKISKKGFDALSNFVENIRTEASETKEASKILRKYISKQPITKEEEFALRNQVYDVLKTVGVGIPFVIFPGSAVLMPLLIKIAKKKGINLLPSAFA